MIVTPIGDIAVDIIVTAVVVAAFLTIAIMAVVTWYAYGLTDRIVTELRIDFQSHRKAIKRHAELSEALELVKQYRADPELAAKLAGFSRETVLAVLTRHVEALRYDIEYQLHQLSLYRQRGYTSDAQKNTEQLLVALQEELRVADRAVQEFAARDGAPS